MTSQWYECPHEGTENFYYLTFFPLSIAIDTELIFQQPV